MAYINCKDGFEFSITWSKRVGLVYCEVEHKDDGISPPLSYPTKVEVRENSMEIDKRDPILEEYIEDPEDPDSRIAPYVPIEVIHDLIDRHGGIDHRAYTFIDLVRSHLDFYVERR